MCNNRKAIEEFEIQDFCQLDYEGCDCGRRHQLPLRCLELSDGALQHLPAVLAELEIRNPFVFDDCNTKAAAGNAVMQILKDAGIRAKSYCLEGETIEPDDQTFARLETAYDNGNGIGSHAFDGIIAVGSGVLNDLGKLLAERQDLPYIIVATAPSMDGYASATSSMVWNGVKVSMPSRMPDAIVADLDILRQAPVESFLSGYGDMLAKYTALCDWRISALVNDEYYCEHIAQLVRRSLARCRECAGGLRGRSPELTRAVMEGLLLTGFAMALAGVSRPASGVEHYFSHLWDMRGQSLGLRFDRHGLQCLVGTRLGLRLYARVRRISPDRHKALNAVAHFDYIGWQSGLERLLGSAAKPLIELESREKKYSPVTHRKRLARILEHWPEILQITEEELPDEKRLTDELRELSAPLCVSDLSLDQPEVRECCLHVHDIRDKYVVTRLLWDLGELKLAAERLAASDPAQ